MKKYQDKKWLIEQYWGKNLSTHKIAKLCDVGPMTIWNWMKRLEVKTRTKSEAISGEKNSNYGKKGEESPGYGRKHTKEELQKMSEANSGENHWNYGGSLSEEHKRKLSEAKRGENHPMFGKKGEDCHNYGRKHTEEELQKMSESHKGEKNPQWLGGISFEPYGLEFDKELRARMRTRDNNQCQICNERENGRKHAIHHIDYDKQNNSPKNLITLCTPCHAKTNTSRQYWQMYFETEMGLREDI